MISTRTAFRISLLGAVPALLLSVAATMTAKSAPPPCGGLAPGYEPVTAFEMTRSVADLHAIFGETANACRKAITDQIDTVDLIDTLAFIPAYTIFLAFVLLGLGWSLTSKTSRKTGKSARANDKPQNSTETETRSNLGTLGALVALIACICDYVENTALFQLSAKPDADTIWIPVLIVATNTKWIGLGVGSAIGGALLWMRGGAWRIGSVICAIGLVVPIGAAFDPPTFAPYLTKALALSWMPMLLAAVLGAFGKSKPAPRAP
jgi:hypothetical protein